MPISLRKTGKATKIAYTVLDSPLLHNKPKKKPKNKQDKQLTYEESRRQ